MINKLNSDIKNSFKKDDKIALFYIKINNANYYYTYNRIDYNFTSMYNSYKVVDYFKAKKLLKKQIKSTL